jgi:hypothetical protein
MTVMGESSKLQVPHAQHEIAGDSFNHGHAACAYTYSAEADKPGCLLPFVGLLRLCSGHGPVEAASNINLHPLQIQGTFKTKL